jgi:sugar phosphate isomerase/epimerase
LNIELLVSSGAFIGRVNGRNHIPFLSGCDTLSPDGFEFMMYESWYDKLDEIVGDFIEKKIPVRVFHADKFIGQKVGLGDEESLKDAFFCMEENCKSAKRLGAKKVVLHLWNGPISDDNIENNIKAYGELSRIADSYGLLLMPENVVCRNGRPMDHILRLADRYPEARFTFDTKMANFHRELSLCYEGDFLSLWKEKRIAHLHINDHRGAYKDWDNVRTRHIGEGDIDFYEFFDFIRSVGYEGTATLECTSMDKDGNIYFDKMNESVRRVRKIISDVIA